MCLLARTTIKTLPNGMRLVRSGNAARVSSPRIGVPDGVDRFEGALDFRLKTARIDMIKTRRPGEGAGTRTVTWFEDFAREAGMEQVTGQAVPGTEAFWAKAGYSVVERGGLMAQIHKDLRLRTQVG
jgi:hypothetical protein